MKIADIDIPAFPTVRELRELQLAALIRKEQEAEAARQAAAALEKERIEALVNDTLAKVPARIIAAAEQGLDECLVYELFTAPGRVEQTAATLIEKVISANSRYTLVWRSRGAGSSLVHELYVSWKRRNEVDA